ncbi:hypothetical protein C8J56DRAFT_886629 [Mycena floridula]|nr:hypothetical protein C8J56DRAFT_886629 [Mycena floridula]
MLHLDISASITLHNCHLRIQHLPAASVKYISAYFGKCQAENTAPLLRRAVSFRSKIPLVTFDIFGTHPSLSLVKVYTIIISFAIFQCQSEAKLDDNIHHAVSSFATTQYVLKSHCALKSLINNASKCKEKYLALSSVPWPSYFSALPGLIGVIITRKTEARHLLTAVKYHQNSEEDSVITGNQSLYPLNFTANTLIPILPAKIIGIGSTVIAFFLLVVSYRRRQMPRKTLPALRRLLDDVGASLSLLADTRHALESRCGLKLCGENRDPTSVDLCEAKDLTVSEGLEKD